MIELILDRFGETFLIKINGFNVRFSKIGYSNNETGIEGLKLNRGGVIKEFPDLKDNPDWKEEAIKRFRIKIASMNNEEEILNYIIDELKKYGYIPKYKRKPGFRNEVIR